jgi:FkbM family methyltransferase
MKGTFFDDKTIDLPPCCVYNGGCWRPDNKGGAQAWDADLLRFIYNQLKEIKDPVFLDVGANTGSVCLMASLLPGSTCEAFEPVFNTFSQLTAAVYANNLQNQVFVHNYALSDKTNYNATMRVPPGPETGMARLNVDGGVFPGEPGRFHLATAYPMDHATWMMPKIDLISIDVEGAELLVLRGGERTLRKHHPALMLEWIPDMMTPYGYTEVDLENFLFDVGYHNVKKMNDTDRYITR